MSLRRGGLAPMPPQRAKYLSEGQRPCLFEHDFFKTITGRSQFASFEGRCPSLNDDEAVSKVRTEFLSFFVAVSNSEVGAMCSDASCRIRRWLGLINRLFRLLFCDLSQFSF